MMPASLALIGAAFSGEARGRAVGTWAAAGAITVRARPARRRLAGRRRRLAADLPRQPADRAGRRGLAWRYVDESRSRDAQPLDVGGALLATAGLAA